MDGLAWNIMPIYYGAEALNEIMMKGNGIEAILIEVSLLFLFSLFFFFLNLIILRKQRQ